MPNSDIDLYSPGDVYSPSQPLAPAPTPDFGNTELDPLRESTNYYSGGGQKVFGQPLPPGVTLNQVTAAYNQLGAVFVSDFLRLGHNVTNTQKAVKWFMDSISNPPAKQKPHARYNLFEHANDPLFCAFSYFAADNNFSAKFIQDCCYWVSEAGRKLAQNNGSSTPAHGRAPQTSDPTAQLTNAQYDQLVAHNEKIKGQTISRLAAKYGDHGYQQVIALAQAQLERLPAADRKHFDCWTGDFPWTHMLSTFEAIDGLYRQAIGAIPNDGASIAQELAAFDSMLRVPSERAKYQRDPQMQARFRELLRLQQQGG
ncbi:hypothetical protein [Pseudomonas sp. BEA3.1]|uniref:hypothetical protein n=1 Tax=Pseudomonas sp. BEA3.1 TaxID=3083251 RepID=UPI002965486B|nr:hypothetical protein [Pseudomonas sp. BEA3.1]MDW2777438.1 hypothetical protein [Pseudomonas sp. BEA3.1]